MSIGSFITIALNSFNLGHHDVSLALACSAIDASAKKLYGNGLSNNQRNKQFLKDNMRIVSYFGFPGLSLGGLIIKCDSIPEINKNAKGLVPIEDIIYHAIRCGLIHECEVDRRLEFVEGTFIGDFNGKFRLPAHVIFGLILAAVLSEPNSKETLAIDYTFDFRGKHYELNNLWGKKNQIIQDIERH